eukprot:CAMPEP_0116871036 /NCGR_PEP_ID=MMETSP0463-20121206/1213_1 /TAXON_ID=181622 /ORGANISM="Strombidinopsis sp, Strain SopsisLIS2011" /LENGTH=59 /DNA_ID=CAMNT_0004508709 /DNA_START=468 /DNA_END=644 /DNA_ORIENTATION=-
MISPGGMGQMPDGFSADKFISNYESAGKRFLFRLAKMTWDYNCSPATVFKVPGYYFAYW